MSSSPNRTSNIGSSHRGVKPLEDERDKGNPWTIEVDK